MLTKIILLLALISSCTSSSVPSSSQYRKLTQMLDLIGQKSKGMGEVSLVTNGKVVYQHSYGFKKQNKNSIYRIGSISKVFTSVMIMKEIERGTISLDTKLKAFYPKVPNSDKITIEHLLRHRSGLVNFTSLPSYSSIMLNKQSEKDHILMSIKNGVNFKPGKKYEYSNTGYVILSLILEKIHKLNFAEVLKNEITKPLNLKHTYIYEQRKPMPGEVISYARSKTWEPSSNTHQSVPMGAGAIVSTSNELASFLWSLFNGEILKERTVEKMKDITEGYGLGIFSIPFDKSKGYGHTGGIDSFVSFGFYFPDSKTVAVNLTNALTMKINDISIGVLSSVYGKNFNLPVFEDIIELPVQKLKPYEGLYKSKSFPLDINVFIKNDRLYTQATGQQKILLDAVSDNTFVFIPASLRISFNSSLGELTLEQGGKRFVLKK